MDNASIHKTNIMSKRILTTAKVIYNAPYSPELNPIEEVFS